MEPIAPALWNLCWLPVAIALFLAPGWLLVSRLGSPAPLLSAFLGSAAILFQWVLLLNATRVPIHSGTLGLGFALISLALAWRSPRKKFLHSFSNCAMPWRILPWLMLLPVLFALTSVALRATIDPLSGWDNIGRWDYLARLVLARGSLAGYPPITTADFEYYAWCDGIPPLVPLLNMWIYANTGSIAPALTAVRVVGEALLLGVVVFRYSRLLWGNSGGLPALATLATSALVLWAVAMGQETGLIAIALVSMLYFLELHAGNPMQSLAFWAGVAAGVGALTREYGLAFPIAGLAALVARKQLGTGGTIFALTAFGLSSPWYFRNWFLTGNPLYPQTLGGLFPGNAIHEETMRYISDDWGLHSFSAPAAFFLPHLFVLAGLLIVAGAWGAWRSKQRSLLAVGGITLITGLWLWSIPQTGGGWLYSTRVLTPALALLAVLSGWIGGLAPLMRGVCILVFLTASADAARRSWLVPAFPMVSPWSLSFAQYHEYHTAMRHRSLHPALDVLVQAAEGKKIVVDNVPYHVEFTMRGGSAVPIFSPLLAVTFDNRTRFVDAMTKLRRDGVRFVTIHVRNSIRLIRSHPFWTELCLQHIPNSEVQGMSIFDLDRLTPVEQPVAASPPSTL